MSDELETAELGTYREEARAWLAANMPARERLADGSFVEPESASQSDEAFLAEARRRQAMLYDAGFAGIPFPVDYGGQGLSYDHERVFLEEALAYDTLSGIFDVSINILGATLVAFGTEEQKQSHVPKILRGEEIWLQFLSEPSGGSDLAGLLTRADRDGDSYIINGQKTWSTDAKRADFALCPTRTRWDVPKHKGISMFILDLTTPGVDMRPIEQINGGAEFCEEFLTDVVVPASNRVGEENEGWRVARGLLDIEHTWQGRRSGVVDAGGVADLVALRGRARPHRRPRRPAAHRRYPRGDDRAEPCRAAHRGWHVERRAGARLRPHREGRRGGAPAAPCRTRKGTGRFHGGRVAPRGGTRGAVGHATCSAAGPRRSPAAATRSCATTCRSRVWACPEKPHPTASCRSTRCRTTRHARAHVHL